MDYNDIRSRIDRTLNSLNARFDENVLENINYKPFSEGNLQGYSMNFGKDDPETIMNKIMIILYNLANFKDHLKNCFRSKKLDPQIIESEVDNSLHLQILIDIVNQEKHGSPLRSNRSGKSPVIKNQMQVLCLSTGTEANSASSFLIHPDKRVEMSGNIKISIDAEIYDDKNNLLFRLDDLIETSYLQWENIIKANNCC